MTAIGQRCLWGVEEVEDILAGDPALEREEEGEAVEVEQLFNTASAWRMVSGMSKKCVAPAAVYLRYGRAQSRAAREKLQTSPAWGALQCSSRPQPPRRGPIQICHIQNA